MDKNNNIPNFNLTESLYQKLGILDTDEQDKKKKSLINYYNAGLNVFRKKLKNSVFDEEEKAKEYEQLTDYEKVPILQEQIAQKEQKLQEKGVEIPKKVRKNLLGYAVDILSVLDILRYPITNTIYHIAEGIKEKEDPLKTATDVVRGLWKGLLLMEKRDSKDVLDYLFNKDKYYSKLKPWQKSIIGIALDIVTDPTTYMTFGASSVLKTGKVSGEISEATMKAIKQSQNVFEEAVEGVVKEAIKTKALQKGVSEEVVNAMGRYGEKYAERVVNNINKILREEISSLSGKTIEISDEVLKKIEQLAFEKIQKLYPKLLENSKSVSAQNIAHYLSKVENIEKVKGNFGKWFNKEVTKLLSEELTKNVDVYAKFLDKLKTTFNVTGNTYEEIIDNIRKTVKYRDYGLNILGKKIISMPLGKAAFAGDILGSVGKLFGKEEEFRELASPIKKLVNYANNNPSGFIAKVIKTGKQFSDDLKEVFDVTNKWSKTYKNLHQDELLEFAKASSRKEAVLNHFNKLKKMADELIKTKGLKNVTEKTYNDIFDNIVFIKELEAAQNAGEDLMKQAAKTMHKIGLSDDEIAKYLDELNVFVANALEDYEKYKPLYENLWQEMHKNLDTMWDELIARGLANPKEKLANYFPRFIKKKDTKDYVLVRDFGDIANIFLKRTIPIKKIGEALNIEYLTPLESLGKYYDKAIKKIQNHDTIERIIKRIGFVLPETEEGKHALKVKIGKEEKEIPIDKIKTDFEKCIVKGFEDYYVPREVNQTLKKVSQIILEEDVGNRIFKYFHAIQNVWKKMVTVFNFPAFQHRNQLSNIWTYILKDGVNKDSLKSIKEAGYLWKKLLLKQNSDKTKVILNIFGDIDKPIKETAEATIDDIYKRLRELGVIKGDFSASMIEEIGQRLKFDVKKTTLKKFEEFASNYGAFYEDMMRTASFFASLRKGATIREAIQDVNKWFINYADLTKFEKNVMKTIFPFYTWLRKNLANQLTAMAENPLRYKLLSNKALEAINGLTPEEEKYLPSYMKTAKWINPFGIRWGEKENERILMVNPNLPFQDIMKVTSEGGIGEALISSLTPAIKTGAELLFNKNLYNKQPIERYEGELKEVPATLQMFVIALPKEIKDKLNLSYDKNGKVLMPAKYVYALENLIPASRLSLIENSIELTKGESYQKERAPFKMLKTITGVSLTPLNINYYRRRGLEDLLYKLKRLQSKQPTAP